MLTASPHWQSGGSGGLSGEVPPDRHGHYPDGCTVLVLWGGGDASHRRELKQAVLVKLLNETRTPDLSAIVFSLRDSGCVFHLSGQ